MPLSSNNLSVLLNNDRFEGVGYCLEHKRSCWDEKIKRMLIITYEQKLGYYISRVSMTGLRYVLRDNLNYIVIHGFYYLRIITQLQKVFLIQRTSSMICDVFL